MKTFTFLLIACSSFGAQAQQRAVKTESAGIVTPQSVSFEEYCLSNATSVISIPASKTKTAISGTLPFKGEKATYKEYGIQLKEEQTQYFTLEGTDKVLAVQSLYRLRLDYTNSNISGQ